MDELTTITSVVAPLPRADIDTDLIYPARFLLLIERSAVAKHLFHDLRRDSDEFVLDQNTYRSAQILVAGSGFGTGSSREHAVWALADNDIRVIIALSLGEIFQANCVKNGILPIVLEGDEHDRIMAAGWASENVTVDLEAQTIELAEGNPIAFEIDAESRGMLLEGVDEIDDIIANDSDDIDIFEKRRSSRAPWLDIDPTRHPAIAVPAA